MSSAPTPWLGEDRPPLTEGEEGGVGEASLAAGDVDADGGVEESMLELEGAASSESPDVAEDGSTIPTFTTPTKGMNL